MDGLPTTTLPTVPPFSGGGTDQHTICAPVHCSGVGLHSGLVVNVRVLPAAAGSGIVFRRTDLRAHGDAGHGDTGRGIDIPALFDAVVDTRLCTVLGVGEARVGTVEHLMAAFAGLGVDNAVVEVDGPEIPVLDGSAEPWSFLLRCAGLQSQPRPRRIVEVLRTVRVERGDAFAELRPHGFRHGGFDMAMSIEFPSPAIGRQAFALTLDATSFERDLARARTFVQLQEIEGLKAAGLARGGSLDTALVVDGHRVLNPGGLRMANEFVRHKLLDVVGDLALAGCALQARFVGHKSGHALNNLLLRALFAQRENFRAVAEADALMAA